MKHRAPVAALVALLLASSSFGQTVGTVGRLPGVAPALIIPGSPALGGGFSMPLLAPLALTPTLALSAIAPMPVAAVMPIALTPVTAAPAALDVAKTLTGSLSATAARSQDQAPALSAAFDGLAAASAADDAPTPVRASSPRGQDGNPELFALQARSLLAAALRSAQGAQTEAAPATDDEILKRMNELPLDNKQREAYITALFKLAGAKDGDVEFQPAGRGFNNVIVTKKGRTDRVIVIGGHMDKTGRGSRGTIDNGTGSTMVANLYQALQDVETDATLIFIGFASEEDGLVGSRAYVRSLTDAKKKKIDAMINLDTLAVNGTFSWGNNSTPALLARFMQVSRESGHALTQQDLDGGDADSTSFRDADIPAITEYGDHKDTIFDDIHNERDNMAIFSLPHYKNAYLLALASIYSLDRTPLGPIARDEI